VQLTSSSFSSSVGFSPSGGGGSVVLQEVKSKIKSIREIKNVKKESFFISLPLQYIYLFVVELKIVE
jgi:hypothetical protein